LSNLKMCLLPWLIGFLMWPSIQEFDSTSNAHVTVARTPAQLRWAKQRYDKRDRRPSKNGKMIQIKM